eukprot:10436024-Alexandrium_andersonii.AAC.1
MHNVAELAASSVPRANKNSLNPRRRQPCAPLFIACGARFLDSHCRAFIRCRIMLGGTIAQYYV